MQNPIEALVQLSHDIGREERGLAILGEGNTSVRLGPGRFAVKASGSCLATLTESDLTVCDLDQTNALLDQDYADDEAFNAALLATRCDPDARKPSIESMFHAWLLGLEGIRCVGHCHPVHANRILCSPRARDFADLRLFPDQVVCCGPASVFVPYADPGLPLARAIREHTRIFLAAQRHVPRLILLENHGIIALGGSAAAVLACLLMAEKAAAIFEGAAQLGGPKFLEPADVLRIASRLDEAYRQRQLNLSSP